MIMPIIFGHSLYDYCTVFITTTTISFMQGIYTYIPETNGVPREYSVAAILLFLFMVHTSLASVLNLLHFYISTFWSMCAVPNMAVFCSSLTLFFIIIIIVINCKWVLPGGSGITVHKITHTHAQNNTQHTKLQA
jgi:hypothetical protein